MSDSILSEKLTVTAKQCTPFAVIVTAIIMHLLCGEKDAVAQQ